MRHVVSRTVKVRAAAAAVLSLAVTVMGCAQGTNMNTRGERYVRLVLAMGQHDADYVDAYYGPPEWRTEVDARKRPLAEKRAPHVRGGPA